MAHRPIPRTARALTVAAVLAVAGAAQAQPGLDDADEPAVWRAGPADADPRWPDQVFVQAGTADEARSAVAGVSWWSGWQADLAGGGLSLHTELSAGRWVRDVHARRDPTADDWVTQVGVAPVLRWQSGGASGAFVEAGIGLNLISPVYQRQNKRFSTTLNFGDHLAVGIRFGPRGAHELALRIEHFSNAGLRLPNPGENFRQLRYSVRL